MKFSNRLANIYGKTPFVLCWNTMKLNRTICKTMIGCFGLISLIFQCCAILTMVAEVALADDLATLAGRYPELKVIQANGIPIRVATEDWDAALRLVARDPDWQKWLDQRRQMLDSWISRFQDRAEWVAGWEHELVDPLTQAPVRWTPTMPEPTDGVGSVQKFKQAWISYSRSYNFDRILEAARYYRLTGEARYAEWAAKQLDFYSSHYATWPLRTWNGKSRMMGQSLDEATGCVQLIEATRLLDGVISGQRLAAWRSGLFMPMVDNLRDFNQGVNNIALWHAVAIAVVGYRFNDSVLINDALNGPKGVRTLMKKGVTADFLWYEGSFSYNEYVLMALNPLFVQTSLMGHSSALQREMLMAQNMLLSPLRFRFPDGKLPSPSDSNARSPAINLGLHETLRRVLPTRVGLVQSMRSKTWDTLVDIPEPLPSDALQLPSVVSTNFEADRMAILKTDHWQAFVHYGQLTQAHAQQEALNFELYRDSTPVSVDQGTVAYGSRLHENYFSRGAAHNVPLVDGIGQDGWNPGRVIAFNAVIPYIEVTQPAYRKDTSATRHLEIINDTALDRVTVKLNSSIKGEHRLGLLFNSDCRIDFDDDSLGSPVTAEAPNGPGFEFWTDVTRRNASTDWSAHLDCKGVRLRLSFKAPGAHSVFHGSVPATPVPARREAVYLELTGRDATFEMRLKPETGGM